MRKMTNAEYEADMEIARRTQKVVDKGKTEDKAKEKRKR
jgi:hypothetical protein